VSQLARPSATLSLTPAQFRIAQKIADGESTHAIARDLTITAGTINVQMMHCGQRLGVSGRATVVHACFVTGQLPRPDTTAFPEAFTDAEVETWRMVAIGATSQEFADGVSISRESVRARIRALRKHVDAQTDAHLVTLGWRYGVLDESLVEMASGTVLVIPARR
jgi:DNA-binding CsgD family transcriptional regulator